MSWATMDWARRVRTGNPGRKAVLMVLAEYADEADSCYPSQATIAEATELSGRSVRRHLADLEAAGVLHREHRGNGQGGRGTDRYHLHVDQGLAATVASGVSGQTTGGYWPNDAGLVATGGQGTPEEHHLGTPELRALPSLGAAELFDSFWQAYPRRTAKADARKAWTRATRKAAPEAVLAGAQRYAADPNLPPVEFVPHPATWLNGERWADGPLPPRTPAGPATRAQRAARPICEDRGGPARRLTDDELWGGP